MPTMKLTKRAVEKLVAPDPSGKQMLYWDAALKGFGVLVSGTTSAKTYIVQRRLPNGRTRRLTVGAVNVFKLDDARTEAEAKLAELYRGVDPKAERRTAARLTLRFVLDDYLAANKDMRAASRNNYRKQVEHHLSDWLDLSLAEITSDMVEARHVRIKEAVQKRNGAGETRGDGTANAVMKILRALWNFAAEKTGSPLAGKINPAKLRKRWFPDVRRERHVSGDDLPKFYHAVCGLPNRTHTDYLLLLLFTGLRRSETASLKWSEVDFAERVIRLPASRTKAGRKLDLPMTDFVHDMMVARRALGRDGDFVFPGEGKHGHIASPDFPLKLIARTSGIQISAHDLRRSYITVAAGTTIPAAALKALVNHALGKDMTDGYNQMTVAMLREPAQKVCDRLKELCQIETITDKKVAKLGRM